MEYSFCTTYMRACRYPKLSKNLEGKSSLSSYRSKTLIPRRSQSHRRAATIHPVNLGAQDVSPQRHTRRSPPGRLSLSCCPGRAAPVPFGATLHQSCSRARARGPGTKLCHGGKVGRGNHNAIRSSLAEKAAQTLDTTTRFS